MQILYGVAFLAIFVLCAALFMTTRRILRPSPLPSGQLDFSSNYSTPSIEDRLDAAVFTPAAMETEPASPIDSNVVEELPTIAVPPFSASISASESVPAKMVVGQPIPGATATESLPVPAEDAAAAMEIEAQPHKSWVSKPSHRTYRRALECLLVGISAFVLIQTQRNGRFRIAHSAGSHVA